MHYGFGGFGMILFWIILVVAIVMLVKTFFDSSKKGSYKSRDSLDILKERYAAGEITHDEFEKIKRNLVGRQKS